MGNSPSPPPKKTTPNFSFKLNLKEPRIVTPTLKSYYVSEIEWFHRPLNNTAKHVGGKHSKIRVEFKLLLDKEEKKNKGYFGALNQHRFDYALSLRYGGFLNTVNDPWKYPENATRTISFVVERHQSGVYISSAKNINYKDEFYAQASEAFNFKNYTMVLQSLPNPLLTSMWGVNESVKLDDFLKKCCAYPKQYKVNSTDCHCFAKLMFDTCARIKTEKVNKLLTKVAEKFGINSESSRRSSPACNYGPIDRVDKLNPNYYDDKDVLKELMKYQ